MHRVYNVNLTWTRYGASVLEGEAWKRTNNVGSIDKNPNEKLYKSVVPCYPLSTLLMAGDLQNLDFLTLDLEGLELQALKTLDWKRHDIKVRFLTQDVMKKL